MNKACGRRSPCRLQHDSCSNTGLLLPSTLKLGTAMQASCGQRLTTIFTMPSSVCRLQYTGVLLPSKLKLGTIVQGSCEQRLQTTFTMLSAACRLQYTGGFLPSKLKLAVMSQGWWWQNGNVSTDPERSYFGSPGREANRAGLASANPAHLLSIASDVNANLRAARMYSFAKYVACQRRAFACRSFPAVLVVYIL